MIERRCHVQRAEGVVAEPGVPAGRAEGFVVEALERARPLVGAGEDDRVRQVLGEDAVLLGEAGTRVFFAFVEQSPESLDTRPQGATLGGP